jgi:hypothetical protein
MTRRKRDRQHQPTFSLPDRPGFVRVLRPEDGRAGEGKDERTTSEKQSGEADVPHGTDERSSEDES